MAEDRIDTCPTCGAPVRVVSADEGTASYQPVAEADNAALVALLREVLLWETAHYQSAERAASDWANLSDRLIAALPNHTPHPGQSLLDRLARLERAVKAARELRRHVAPHPPEDFPKIEHICGGPNAVCDGECVEAAWMAEDNMAFHRFDAALAALDGTSPAPEEAKPS